MQIGRIRGSQQHAHRAQRQHLPRGVQRAQRRGIIALFGVNHAAIRADNQDGFRIGLARVGLGPRGFFVSQNALAGKIQSNFAALVGRDERRLPVRLLRQQSVADCFHARGFDLLQAAGAAHRVQREVYALSRGYAGAAWHIELGRGGWWRRRLRTDRGGKQKHHCERGGADYREHLRHAILQVIQSRNQDTHPQTGFLDARVWLSIAKNRVQRNANSRSSAHPRRPIKTRIKLRRLLSFATPRFSSA